MIYRRLCSAVSSIDPGQDESAVNDESAGVENRYLYYRYNSL